MKIGIFGGTFNPPHIGHFHLAEHFNKNLAFDKLLIIPTFSPVHKESTDLASSEDRMNMCRLAFSDLENAEISDIEIKRGGKSYTYDTLLEVKKVYPESDLFLIIGSDMLLTFKGWYKADEILKICTICAADRNNENSCLDDETGMIDRVIFSSLEPFDISSSEIREMIKQNKDVSKYITKDILNYIVERRLYHD